MLHILLQNRPSTRLGLVMDSTALYDAFRSDVVDTARPYLWSEDEVWRYANDAYRMFVRLIGGVPDFDSDICAIDVVAGEAVAEINPNILRIMSATRRSDSNVIEIINSTDLGKMRSKDYGQTKQLVMDNVAGPVRYAVLGLRKNALRWIQVPIDADIVDLVIYRLPLNTISDHGQELTDVEEDHHIHLLSWMKHLAYKKHDADTFDAAASDKGEADFRSYCAVVRAEMARYQHKTRTVTYGGL